MLRTRSLLLPPAPAVSLNERLVKWMPSIIAAFCTQTKLQNGGVVESFEWYGKSKPHVIPAKAGIHPANLWRCAFYRLDSRFRGNDVWFDMNPRPNDATTNGDANQIFLDTIPALP